MSKDEPALPVPTGAEGNQGQGEPLPQPRGAADTTLRGQVLALIDELLADSDPDGEWARAQLREHVASHPGEPERALLAHLIETRKKAPEQHPLPAPPGPVMPDPSANLLDDSVPPDDETMKRIQSVLGSRLLLTAFQPVRELPGGRVTGFEALARFVSSDGAGPDTWFAEAEAVGLGPELEIAALQCAVSAARGIPLHLFVAFNISPGTLLQTRVRDVLQNSGRAMDKMILELRGRASEKQWNALIRKLEPLRQQGLRVAVDGSGAGFTPSDRILSLRPDIIKVDRTFIDGLLERPERDEPAVVVLAREVGAVLAAEGIETEDELTAVIGAGLTAGQGYLLGRPSVHPLDWSAWVIQAGKWASAEM